MSQHICLKLFATLSKKSPEYSDCYPIKPGITVRNIINELEISETDAKLIFINSKKADITSSLQNGDRLGIFPPIGGG